MRYSELSILTHRADPAQARSPGEALLVRAGYVSHGGDILPLGQRVIDRLAHLAGAPDLFVRLQLPVLTSEREAFFPVSAGPAEILNCPECGAVSRRELAQVKLAGFSSEPPLPMEKVATPDCVSIESLAQFLGIPEPRTAKALMLVRETDGRFIVAVVRGDRWLSEAKLGALVGGSCRLARDDEIRAVGAEPGYASPVGLTGAWVVVDELVAESPNLVAGANSAGYHLRNVNCGRDYVPDRVADLTLARAGDPCGVCGAGLQSHKAWVLMSRGPGGAEFDCERLLRALAEVHRDEKGLALPSAAAPFRAYLMHIPGKTMDTRAAAGEMYRTLTEAGIAVLFDDRDERAGVKFNDADLIGCPVRIAVGERGLRNGVVEWKRRRAGQIETVGVGELAGRLRELA